VIDHATPAGRRVEFTIGRDRGKGPTKASDGTVSGGTATCVACQATAPARYLREQAQGSGLGKTLMAVVAAGNRRRIYTAATEEHHAASLVERPAKTPDQKVPT